MIPSSLALAQTPFASATVPVPNQNGCAKGRPPTDAPHDILSDDPRLDAKVTLTRRDINLTDALIELTKQTKVALAVGGKKASSDDIAVAVKGVSLRDVLRALVAIYDDHWRRVKTSEGQEVLTLTSLMDDPRYWDFLRPHSQAEADQQRAIQSFADAAATLSPDMRQALAVEHHGLPYASLPAEMQQSVQNALKPELEKLASKNFPTKISLDKLDTMRICFYSKTDGQTTNYTLNVTRPDTGNVMIGFLQPNDPRARDETIQPADFVPWQQSHLPTLLAAYNAARDRAAKNDPRLAQSVSLKSDDCSVGYPLVALADAAHIPIIASVLPMTHSITCGPLPLKEAFDQIAAKYRGSWTVSDDGVIIFHELAASLPGFWTPEEIAAQAAAARADMEEQSREMLIKQAPPGATLVIDGTPVKRDTPSTPGP